jgi:hypothetical protein
MRMRARPTVRSLIRLAAVVPMLGGLTVIGAAAHVGLPLSSCAQAATEHHASLVVEHSDGSGHGAGPVIKVCVAFTEDSITGEQLLTRSGVEYMPGDSGQAVCQIDQEPASYPPGCWTASSPYWAMYVSRGSGSWAYSSLGFTSQTFRDGDAEGFRYEGQDDGTTPPSPRGVCPTLASPTPAPAKSATPTAHSLATAPTPKPSRVPASASVAASAGTTVVVSASPGATSKSVAVQGARGEATIQTANRAATLPTLSAGVWAAGALASALLLALLVQLARARRRAAQRPPP